MQDVKKKSTSSAQSAVSGAASVGAAPAPPSPLVPVTLLSRLSRGRGRSGDGCREGSGLLTERGEGLLNVGKRVLGAPREHHIHPLPSMHTETREPSRALELHSTHGHRLCQLSRRRGTKKTLGGGG